MYRDIQCCFLQPVSLIPTWLKLYTHQQIYCLLLLCSRTTMLMVLWRTMCNNAEIHASFDSMMSLWPNVFSLVLSMWRNGFSQTSSTAKDFSCSNAHKHGKYYCTYICRCNHSCGKKFVSQPHCSGVIFTARHKCPCE